MGTHLMLVRKEGIPIMSSSGGQRSNLMALLYLSTPQTNAHMLAQSSFYNSHNLDLQNQQMASISI